MDPIQTGEWIAARRKEKELTQKDLAARLGVTDKAVSRWETGKGYPDVTLLEPLAAALGVSMIELFSGERITNTNASFNMLRMKLYVCPVCGNFIVSIGEAVISCCGIVLPVLEAEEEDRDHPAHIETVEDEYCVTVAHEMSKAHYISFILAVMDDGYELKKLYPEGNAEARFKISRTRWFYYYCNRHGLFRVPARPHASAAQREASTCSA